MRHIIDFTDITHDEWAELYRKFLEIRKDKGDFRGALQGKVMASLFYEPSTRTRFSFEGAMHFLGGAVLGFSDTNCTSMAKGENLRDTAMIVSSYSDVIVCRHPKAGAAKAFSLYSSCPIINAGDGKHFHPTQTLTDLAAINLLRGSVDGLTVGICGDLINGRTVHSLLGALNRFSNVKIVLISPDMLKLPKEQITKHTNLQFAEAKSIEDVIGDLDILYMTRIQRERLDKSFQAVPKEFILTGEQLKKAKKDLSILHPLPRENEISPEVDTDPRAKYFFQAKCGLHIRMALLLQIAKLNAEEPGLHYNLEPQTCKNKNCITQGEQYLPVELNSDGICAYCDDV